MNGADTPVVGVIEAKGTGGELAEIFRRVVKSLYFKSSGKDIRFTSFEDRFGYRPNTYSSLSKNFSDKGYPERRAMVKEEVDDLATFLRDEKSSGTHGVFITSINAETLYALRLKERIVKTVPLQISDASGQVNLIFVRDQLQGYYGNMETEVESEKIGVCAEFKLQNFDSLIQHALQKCKVFRVEPERFIFIYKYHLFGCDLNGMIDAAARRHRLDKIGYDVYPPEIGVDLLFPEMLNKGRNGNVVVICGNEVGNMLLKMLLYLYGLGTKETFYVANQMLDREGFELLQTMHGSADDLMGTNRINPTATLKAGAHALQYWLGVEDALPKMMEITGRLSKDERTQPGMDTTRFVNAVLDMW